MSKYALIVALLAVSSAYAETKWTHLPDGRWMFVDPNNPPAEGQMCDFEHHCYGAEDGAPAAPSQPKIAPAPRPQRTYPSIAEVPLETAPCQSEIDYGPPHAMGTGCGHWPLGSDADLDCRQGRR